MLNDEEEKNARARISVCVMWSLWVQPKHFLNTSNCCPTFQPSPFHGELASCLAIGINQKTQHPWERLCNRPSSTPRRHARNQQDHCFSFTPARHVGPSHSITTYGSTPQLHAHILFTPERSNSNSRISARWNEIPPSSHHHSSAQVFVKTIKSEPSKPTLTLSFLPIAPFPNPLHHPPPPQ